MGWAGLKHTMYHEAPSSDNSDRRSGGASRDAPKRKRRRRGCFRKLALLALIIVPIGLLLLNGPIFRWVIDLAIQKGASSIGIAGDVTVEGSLLSGIELVDAKFTGDGTKVIDSIQIGDAKLDYSLRELIKSGGLGWIRGISLTDADVSVTLIESDGKEAPTSEKGDPKQPIWSESNPLWQLLDIRYSIDNVTVRVHQADEVFLVEDFSLDLPDGPEGKLSIARLEIPGIKAIERFETKIGKTSGSITLGPLSLIEAVEVSSLTFQQATDNDPFLTASLVLAGGAVEAGLGADGAIRAQMSSGAISLPELLRLAEIDELSSGSVEELDLVFTGVFGKPATWDSEVELTLNDLEWGLARVDGISLNADLTPGDGNDEVIEFKATRSGALLEATVLAQLENVEATNQLAAAPLKVDAKFDIKAVEDLLADFISETGELDIPAEGALAGSASVNIAEQKLITTSALIASDSLSYAGVPIQTVQLNANLEKLEKLNVDADVALDDQSLFKLAGTLDPNTLAYTGEADVSATMVGRLGQLLTELGFEKELEAAATVAWEGGGNLKEKEHWGTAKVEAKGVRYDRAVPFDTALEGSYTNFDLDLKRISLVSEKLQVDGALAFRDSVLELTQLEARSGDLLLLEGRVVTPFALDSLSPPARYFTQTGPVDIDLRSSGLELDSILGLFKEEPPVDCRLGLVLKASGTPSDLELSGALTADDIVIPSEGVEPARAEIDLSLHDAVAGISGRFEQAQIEPFVIEGSMPFRPREWVEGTRDPMTEPISVTARMKESQLGFLAAYTTAIEQLQGAIDVDIALSGSVSQPSLVGSAGLRVESLSFTSPKAPSVRDVAADLRFEEQFLHIDKLHALVAGGDIGIGGSIGFTKGGDPELDIQLGGREVLVHRNDSVSVRTDIDAALKGPLSAAALTGTIGVTSSLFYKNFDLFPVGIPGRGGGKSALPEVDPGPKMPIPKSIDVGVPIEPFSNWEVDLRIMTKDPFRVAGNLAQAEVLCDIRIDGTLGTPVPNGRIWVPKGRVTLPFSKIDFSEAEVILDEETGFNGALLARANSEVGDYRVSIFARDRVLSPEIVFTSLPPLAREDILTLLASGVTREDLTGGSGTAATKAFMLWVKSLSDKDGRIDPDAPPTFAETLEERTDVSVGKVDPDSGEIGINASIRLWRESYLEFGFGNEGRQRGVLKYVFRFR